MDIYKLWRARATKYFTLGVKEEKCQYTWDQLDNYVTKNTFNIKSGKHDADCVNIYGLASYFYSDKFITMIEENGVNNFDKHLINIDDTGYEVQNRYYHIELKSEIPRIDRSIYSHPEVQAEIEEFCQKNNTLPQFIPDKVLQQFVNNYCQKNNIRENDISMQYFINEYCKKNNVRKNDLLEISKGDTYGDLSKWDGSNIFKLADSRSFLVTDEIKKASEKMKLKNIKYVKLNRYEESKINGA